MGAVRGWTRRTCRNPGAGSDAPLARVAAVADGIDDGVWLVLNQGWSGFYFQGADFGKDPYINGWNYPGLTPAAVDKIIEIENAKGVRINGIMSDVIGVETGQNSRGEDEAWTNSWYAHVKGLQRGWKLIENGNNLGQLAMATPGSCMLVAGARRDPGDPAAAVSLSFRPGSRWTPRLLPSCRSTRFEARR